MANDRISFKVEEQQNLVKLYRNALKELGEETRSLAKKISDIAVKDNYKLEVEATNATIQFYQESMSKIMQDNYDEWINSSASLEKLVAATGAGDTAIDTARTLQGKVQIEINDLFSNRIELVSVDGASPNIDPERINKLVGHISKYINSIETLKKKFLGKIDNESDKNKLFSYIRPHVDATYSSAHVGFMNKFSDMKELSAALVATLEKSAKAVEAANSGMKSTAESTASSVDEFPPLPFF